MNPLASRAQIVMLLLIVAVGAAFIPSCADPNDNPVRDVAVPCQSHSQDHSYFGSAFTYENETGRAELTASFRALAENTEPTLACGSEPDEAYRLSIVGHWPKVPLIITAQRSAGEATLRATFPRHDPSSGALIPVRLTRHLSRVEWSSLSADAEAINLRRTRAILAPTDESYARRRLLEFRRDDSYGLVYRPAVRSGDALDAFTVKLIQLASVDYPWF